MRTIFIDSANIDDIRKWNARLNCSGVTTNQKIFSTQKNVDFKKTIINICKLLNLPVSVELTTHQNTKSMVAEAETYTKWNKNVVIKVPLTLDGIGLEVVKILSKKKIRTNVTLMVSFEQMLLAINAGATYASILLNRSKDAGYDGLEIIKRSRNFIDAGNYKTLIITGSIRKSVDVGDSFEKGSDITIPPSILDAMLLEKKTQETIKEFDEAWEKFKKG
jgi:transaldolase